MTRAVTEMLFSLPQAAAVIFDSKAGNRVDSPGTVFAGAMLTGLMDSRVRKGWVAD
jgi:hypothetical protein